MRLITPEELKKYNGRNGNPAYVCVRGIIYDVSDSDLWKNGIHFQRHLAGRIITDEELEAMPHSFSLVESRPIVGYLKQE